ncbi:MAG: FAD-dependent oxidoreductase, partial [Clostridiales bacterium]|nr:FAD-dependent oxidoreductase [Clostridiales bacterium]
MARKVVIIGGVAGGAGAAVRARRLDEQADIVLLEKGGYISFANCGLPYYIGDTIKRRKDLLVQTPKAMKARFNIDVRVENEAVKIDPAAKTVEVQNHATGETYQEPYDKLIIATGSVPVIPPIPGADEDNIFTIWSIPDTDKIKEYVTAKALKRAAVVGGGFVGMEMVENLHAIGLEVSVVEMLDQVMNTVDFDMAQYVHRELRASGVALYLEEKVVAFRREGDETLVELGSGKQLPVDLVIMAAGIKPSSALAADAGLTLGPRGHIVTNEYLQTSNPDIYAVGDVIEVEDFMTKGRTAVPLAGPANKQGRIAADNVCGIPSKYHGTQGTSVAKVFDKTIASTGLTEKALIRAGKKPYEDFLALHG